MKEYSIGCAWRSCVGFKYGCHEDKRYTLSIGIKIMDLKRTIWYDQEEEMKMNFLCGTQISHALAYVLSHGGSRSWGFDFKRRIQDMALSRCHNSLMSWAMVDQDFEHAIKWRVIYVPQDIL